MILGFGLFTVSFAQEPPSKKEDLHVYLLIGQSNMAGRAPFTEMESKPIKGVFLLNGEAQWEPASNPLNRYSTIRKGLGMQRMNPGYQFALEMSKQGQAIGLVVNARGGISIEQWAVDTKFYREAIRRAREAQKTGTLKGVLWHQGESNHGDPQSYAQKLAVLVERLRLDLGDAKLPFVAGQIVNPSPINDEIAKLPGEVNHTAFASSEGLKTYDRWHFDAPSTKELGKRYADAMKKLLK